LTLEGGIAYTVGYMIPPRKFTFPKLPKTLFNKRDNRTVSVVGGTKVEVNKGKRVLSWKNQFIEDKDYYGYNNIINAFLPVYDFTQEQKAQMSQEDIDHDLELAFAAAIRNVFVDENKQTFTSVTYLQMLVACFDYMKKVYGVNYLPQSVVETIELSRRIGVIKDEGTVIMPDKQRGLKRDSEYEKLLNQIDAWVTKV
jgi:hypothetical protein